MLHNFVQKNSFTITDTYACPGRSVRSDLPKCPMCPTLAIEMSGIKVEMSVILSEVPSIKFKMSVILFEVSGMLSEVSGIKVEMSVIPFRVEPGKTEIPKVEPGGTGV